MRSALIPLLTELADPTLHRPGCAIVLGILPTPRINAAIGRSRAPTTPCTTFGLMVSEGALTRLPEPMLRAVLAHELGHVSLKHTGANSKAQESAADEFAARLLKRLEPRYPEACVQLVYVFSVMAEHGSIADAWLSAHPSPDRRAEETLRACNR